MDYAVVCAKAFNAYFEQEYENAIGFLEEIPYRDMRSSIEIAMLYAKVAIAKGDAKTAKTKLEYIVRNGNKLYAVKEAQQMLEYLVNSL